MDLIYAIDPGYAVAGLGVGFLVGMTGVGGGALMTPLLISVFGIPPAVAVGTDLLYTAVSRSLATLIHGVNRNIDWTIVRRLAAGSIPATVLTLAVLWWLGMHGKLTGGLITYLLGGAILTTALALIFRKQLAKLYGHRIDAMHPNTTRWLTIGMGVLLGVVVSITSVGAGAIGVTVLVMLYPRLTAARIVGSDIAHAVPLAFIAGAGYLAIGVVDGQLLLSLLARSLSGVAAGSVLAPYTPEGLLRYSLAGAMFLAAAKLFHIV
jgi:uncharacterized membrane protein YfcA